MYGPGPGCNSLNSPRALVEAAGNIEEGDDEGHHGGDDHGDDETDGNDTILVDEDHLGGDCDTND